MAEENVDLKRRRVLAAGVGVVGGVGVLYSAIPFVMSMNPSARTEAAAAPVELDPAKIDPGQRVTVEWRGRPVWVVHRTDEMLDTLPELEDRLRDPESEVTDQQPPYAQNRHRSIKPEYLVLVGICTHLGCSPSYRPEFGPADLGADWKGGFFCACHGSRFDLAGRVYRGVPATLNLVVPPHHYTDDDKLVVGEDAAEEVA